MTTRYRFPDELTYEITSADLAADWLLLQKAGENRVGKAHPSVIGVGKSDSNPVALGTAAPGTSSSVSRADHAHPTTGISGTLTPASDSVYDLGSASLSWNDCYVGPAGRLFFGSSLNGVGCNGSDVYFQTNSTIRCSITGSGHFVPKTDNTYDLGSVSYAWRNVYIDGTTVCAAIQPRANNSYDLGSYSSLWRDLYLDGEVVFDPYDSNLIGTGSGGAIYFQTAGYPRCGVDYSTGAFSPASDNTYDVGSSGLRWDDVYATNGTIQTSSESDKTDIADSDMGLDFVLALRPKSYRWAATASEIIPPEKRGGKSIVKRKPGVRRHYGLIAQDVRDTLAGKDFAGYIHDQASDSYGLRYSEFIAPLIKAVQELAARVAELESAQPNPPKKEEAAPADAA